MRSSSDFLFRDGELRQIMEKQDERLKAEIEGFDKDYLLSTPINELVDYLVDKYRLEVPELDRDNVHVANHGETDIDVSQDRLRHIRDRSKPFYVKGGFVEVAVPFEGDPDLFQYRATTHSLSPPVARIAGGEVRLRYEAVNQQHADVTSKLKKDLDNITKHLSWVRFDVTAFNDSLQDNARNALKHRKERVLKHEGMVASLDLPIKRRNDTSDTYAAPISRKKTRVHKPQNTNEPFEPEPTLANDVYDDILDVIRSMVDVMERSPHAFVDMDEEDMRTQILVQLNNQFEGEATGETFNYEGKTDIHIRADGKNVFIAECKFWRGPKAFREAIDQLLGYASWRDTKTALVIFNRNKNLTSVLEKIPPVVQEHPNFRREIASDGETEFRFVLHHKNDEKRDVTLAVLVFDVPRSE
jgi:hypothetical protein